MKLGIIGCGVMGSAIGRAYKGDVIGFDRDLTKVEFEKAESVEDLVEKADVVLLAVKPQDFRKMEVDFGGKLVISIMAGVPLADLSAKKAVRVMPNLGAKVGKSVSAWVAGSGVSDEEKGFVAGLLGSFGVWIEVKSDDEIYKMTALTGSGPAYFYAFMKAMMEVGQEFGFEPEILKKILPTLIEGSMEAAEGDFEGMIAKVASKGGTTEAALNVLGDEWGDKLKDAVKAAYERAKRL